MNEEFIKELLDGAKKHGIRSRERFLTWAEPDYNAGYKVEVLEAARRLFGR